MPTELEFGLRLPGSPRVQDARKGMERLAFKLGKSVEDAAPVLAKEIENYLNEVRLALIQRHSKPFSNPTNAPATGEDDLLRRSGGITNIRVAIQAANDLNQIAGRLIVPFPISVHEKGATIKAKRSQYLTIPMPAALDSRGIPLRRSARDWENTFVQRSKRGNLLIFQRQGGTIVPLYLLKRSVKIPPRLEAQKTINAGADFFVDHAIDAMAKAILAGVVRR